MSDDASSVPNNSIVSPCLGMTAPNSSMCGMPPMTQPLTDDHLAYGLMQAKLYQCLEGTIAPEDVWADVSVDGNPHWQAIVSLLKDADRAKYDTLFESAAGINLDQFKQFVAQYSQ
jgi:hypothetical protein